MKVKRIEVVRPTSVGGENILVFVPFFIRWTFKIISLHWKSRQV